MRSDCSPTSALVRTGAVSVAALLLASGAWAEDPETGEGDDRLEALERRIDELEAAAGEGAEAPQPAGADWTRWVRLGGSVDTGFFGGQENSGFDDASFKIWDARFFVDAYLGDAVHLGDVRVFRNLGFAFEWNLVRLGELDNNVGEVYVDFQGVLSEDAFNFQVGRFQLPVGESYLRYSQGYADKPFVVNTVGGPWWWDEGVRVYGSFADGALGYVASVADGETPFNRDVTDDKLVSLKLYWHATDWLYMSASGLRTGRLGSSSSPASGALWLGESWARAFGSRSDVPNYQNGALIADGPNRLHDTWFVGGDVVLEQDARFRIWLAGGWYTIDSAGGGTYDRDLYYWIAEVVLEGAWATPVLEPFYLGLRANALGTYDPDRGYLLDKERSGSLGYNMESITDASAVLGWVINDYVRIRLEYTHREIDVIDGVAEAIRDTARHTDFYAIEVGGSF